MVGYGRPLPPPSVQPLETSEAPTHVGGFEELWPNVTLSASAVFFSQLNSVNSPKMRQRWRKDRVKHVQPCRNDFHLCAARRNLCSYSTTFGASVNTTVSYTADGYTTQDFKNGEEN